MEHEDPKLNRLLRLYEEANRDTVTPEELATVINAISNSLQEHYDYVDKEIEEVESSCREVQNMAAGGISDVQNKVIGHEEKIIKLQTGLKNLLDKVQSLPQSDEILREVDKRLSDTIKTWDVSDIKDSVIKEAKNSLPNDTGFVKNLDTKLKKLTGDEIVELISKAKNKISAQNIKDLPQPNTVVYSSSNTGSGTGSAITVKDEGSNLTTALASLNFVGAGVTATTSGDDVTVTIAGGSGAVDSVNGQTGVVVLDADDIDDTSTTNKFVTATDITNLSNLSGTNSGDVSLAGEDYLSLTGQQITANAIDLDNLSATGTPSSSTFLRGDNTWATPAGSGDVSKVGTPVNNQVGVWTGDGTIEGDAALTFDTTTDTLTTGTLNSTSLTASEIVITDGSKNLVSAAVATYPSLTELAYVKGVTSAIQTQLDAKQASDAQLTSIAGLSYTGNALKVVRVNAGETDFELATVSGGSGITRTVVTTSGSATMGSTASTDYVYFVAGAHTMSLPAASGNTNRYTVKNNHSANISIDTAGAENIEGAASISIAPEESVDIMSDGTNWFVV